MARPRDPSEFLDTFGAMLRGLTQLAAQRYAELDLGSTQAKFLRHIGTHGRVSQAELARITGTDPTLTGRVMQALLERDYVRRERSDEDRREYVVELTAAGKRQRERVVKMRTQIATHLVASLDERDLEDFYRIAKKLVGALEG